MTRAPRRAFLILPFLLIGAVAVGVALGSREDDANAPRPDAQRPSLMLLTSLPLIFDEGFTLRGGGSLAVSALRKRYRIVPISTANPEELSNGRMLLMAHAPAQTAENLVGLDAWVRRGGRVMVLADPLLEWPSKRPLGDPLRPAPMFPDTGLLAHWGLRLDAPDQRGFAPRALAGEMVVTASPGRLRGSCRISSDGFVADCRVGSGRAIIIADADFLNVGALPAASEHNLDALLAELAKLESP